MLTSESGKERKEKIYSEHVSAKVYRGTRLHAEVTVTVNGRDLDPRFVLRNHSPTGFEWGYGGSGPAQLALALLADHLGDPGRAQQLYQGFKRSIVAALPRQGWTLTNSEIAEALRAIESEEAR